jgi:hypothetical protein
MEHRASPTTSAETAEFEHSMRAVPPVAHDLKRFNCFILSYEQTIAEPPLSYGEAARLGWRGTRDHTFGAQSLPPMLRSENSHVPSETQD